MLRRLTLVLVSTRVRGLTVHTPDGGGDKGVECGECYELDNGARITRSVCFV